MLKSPYPIPRLPIYLPETNMHLRQVNPPEHLLSSRPLTLTLTPNLYLPQNDQRVLVVPYRLRTVVAHIL